jgi:hypothetical protein
LSGQWTMPLRSRTEISIHPSFVAKGSLFDTPSPPLPRPPYSASGGDYS